jgi:hypothetical protein
MITHPNQNPAFRYHIAAWHKILAMAMMMSDRCNTQSPQAGIVQMVIRNVIVYIILLSMVRDKLTNFVITTLILLAIGQICDVHGHDIPLNTPPRL